MDINKEFKIKTNKEGEKVLIKTEEQVLDRDFIKRELNRIYVDKENIKRQVNFYQTKYKELLDMENIYKKELEELEEVEEDLIFDLE